jgi:hypothetical protein
MKCATRSTTLSVVIGVVFIVLTAIGLGFWFFASHHESNTISTQAADAEFSQLRSRFSNQQPLIDMSLRQPVETSTLRQSVTSLHTFHTVILDTRGSQRIVHITVPFWFARLFADRDGRFRWLGQLTFLDDTEFDSETIRLSLDQIEQWGPGLIVDYQHPSGGQFISWVE